MLTLGTWNEYKFLLLENASEVDNFTMGTFCFFRGLGIIDYKKTFKVWLRKFPRPTLIFCADSKKKVVGWVFFEEGEMSPSMDGFHVHILRAIEVDDENKRHGVGKRLAYLGIYASTGYIIVKPLTPDAKAFFEKMGFEEITPNVLTFIKMGTYHGHVFYHPYKRGTIKKNIALLFNNVNNNLTGAESMKKNLGIFYNPSHVYHKSNAGSPESPERLTDVMRLLKGTAQIFEKYDCDIIEKINDYGIERILRVHDDEYVKFIENYCRKGGGFLGDSTYFTPKSFDIACKAAYGTIQAAEAVVDGHYSSAIAMVRPPGHHAKSNRYGGYCIFNNAAIAARYLQDVKGKKKIMIVDYDAHAGNGTSQIFYSDPSVLFISAHQNPKDFYPSECFSRDIGSGPGRGFNVNIEMEKGSGDADYIEITKGIVDPLYEKFNPDFVIICIGFDTHHSDKYTGINLTSETYFRIGRRISERYPGKSVVVVEGGYNKNVGMLIYSMISGFFGDKNPFRENIDILSMSVIQKEKINKANRDNRILLKEILSEYFKLNV